MSIRKLPSGSYQARVMVNGVRYAATVPTRGDAEDCVKVIRANAVTGGLPQRITVKPYSMRWILGPRSCARGCSSWESRALRASGRGCRTGVARSPLAASRLNGERSG